MSNSIGKSNPSRIQLRGLRGLKVMTAVIRLEFVMAPFQFLIPYKAQTRRLRANCRWSIRMQMSADREGRRATGRRVRAQLRAKWSARLPTGTNGPTGVPGASVTEIITYACPVTHRSDTHSLFTFATTNLRQQQAVRTLERGARSAR